MKLSPAEVTQELSGLQGWTAENESIRKQYRFKSFPDAIAFITLVAFEAETADHHPDLHVSYRKVTVTWSTHSEGGVTSKDFAGARQSDMIAARLGA